MSGVRRWEFKHDNGPFDEVIEVERKGHVNGFYTLEVRIDDPTDYERMWAALTHSWVPAFLPMLPEEINKFTLWYANRQSDGVEDADSTGSNPVQSTDGV